MWGRGKTQNEKRYRKGTLGAKFFSSLALSDSPSGSTSGDSSMIYRIVTQLRHGLDGSAQGKKNHLPMKNFISFNSLFYSRIERHHRRQVCFSRRLFLNRPRQVAQIQNCYFCDKDSLNTTNRSSFWAKSVARVKISVKINRCLCAARSSWSKFRAPHSQSSVQR